MRGISKLKFLGPLGLDTFLYWVNSSGVKIGPVLTKIHIYFKKQSTWKANIATIIIAVDYFHKKTSSWMFDMVLNMPGILNNPGLWIYFWFWIWQDFTKFWNIREYTWIIPEYAWLCLVENAWISQNMHEYAYVLHFANVIDVVLVYVLLTLNIFHNLF